MHKCDAAAGGKIAFSASKPGDRQQGCGGRVAPAAHPAVTNESITRFRPAVSNSISSLLPSISAIAP